jgi:nucleotide-binding universal stress UspA family protein
VALDGSACSERAFVKARKLARAVNAELVLYRAIKMSCLDPHPEPYMAEVEDELRRMAATCPELKTRVRVYPTDGDPYIVERAEQLEADLIVMGSHGHGCLRRIVMGSVAERVVHQARYPVLFVH